MVAKQQDRQNTATENHQTTASNLPADAGVRNLKTPDTATSIANEVMNTVHPENSWKNPVAAAGPMYCAAMPVPATRSPLATIAIGTLEESDRDSRAAVRGGEVAVEHRQREERQQRPDTAAGFGDFKRRVRERDDVAFPQHRNPGQVENRHSEPRREELQGKGDLIEHHRRDRNHQEQERQREQQDPQPPPSGQKDDHPGHDADHRDAHQEEFNARRADEQDSQAGADHEQPDD